MMLSNFFFFFFQAEDGIRDKLVTGVQTCALPIFSRLKSMTSWRSASPPKCSSASARTRAPASAGATSSSATASSDASIGRARSRPEKLKIASGPRAAMRRSITRRARSSLTKSSSVERMIAPRAYGSPAANSLPKRSVVTRLSSRHHDQDVARVHRLSGLHAHLGHRPRARRLELVLHLHGLDHDQRVAGPDGVPDSHRDAADLTRKRGGERPAPRPARRPAARADDVARLLLDRDLVPLPAHLDHAGAVAIGDVGDVRHPVDQEGIDARRGEARVHLPDVVADGHAVAAVGARDVHHPALVVDGRDVLHGRLHPRMPAARHAEGAVSAGGAAAAGRPRSYSASTAAISAIGSTRDSLGGTGGSTRARKPVESRPARKSGWATTRASTGIVVRTPTTRYSASARAIRSHAASRSAPHTMSLLMSVSYQRGTV